MALDFSCYKYCDLIDQLEVHYFTYGPLQRSYKFLWSYKSFWAMGIETMYVET